MKGEILIKALEIIHDQIMSQADFFAAVLESGYGASMGRIDYAYGKRQRAREDRYSRDAEIQIRRTRLRKFISKMKQDGLVETTGKGKTEIKISSKGKAKFENLKNALPGRRYQNKSQNTFTIISFYIPEKSRRKRNWLREVIKNLGFKMVHQSVWMGKVKIPQTMILDMENLNILEYVEIFEISKTGTLKKIGKT